MALFKLIVKKRDHPQHLGSFLLKNGFSRQAISKAKHHGGLILVNHKRRCTGFPVYPGDEVIFLTAQEKENPWLKPSNKKVDIVKETKNYLIVNKPANLLSIPSRYEDSDALVNRLMSYFAKQKNSSQPHIITRLDRDTSGLVLVGKNAVAHARFSKLNKNVFIKKYHAIVHGHFASNELQGLIDQPIAKLGNKVKRSVDKNGKTAQTEYRVLTQKDKTALVEIRLLTGRTHQIRVHMAYLGHCLVGDQLYGIQDDFSRQALNCCYLEFPDPFSGEKVTIKISDPQDMKQVWKRAK